MPNQVVNTAPVNHAPVVPKTPSSWEPSHPVLPRILKLHKSLGATGDQLLGHLALSLEQSASECEAWSAAHLEQLTRSLQSSWGDWAWGVLQTATAFVIALPHVFGGIQLVRAPNTQAAGYMLLAAGAMHGIQALNQSSLWNWVSKALADKNEATQQRLKRALPMLAFFLNLALSSYGARIYQQVNPGHITAWVNQVQVALSYIQQAGGIYGFYKRHQNELHHLNVEKHLKFYETQFDTCVRLFELMSRELKQARAPIKKSAHDAMNANVLAARKV